MRQRWQRVLLGPTYLSLVCAALALAPPTAFAAGPNQYSPPDWWPLRGSTLIGCARKSPGNVCRGTYHPNWAIDVDAREGTPVYASGAGLAKVFSDTTACTNFGRAVVVDHNGSKSLYAHLSRFSDALRGSPGGVWVDEQTVIGYIGHTGNVSNCTYAHLHYEETTSGGFGSSATDPGGLKGCIGGSVARYPNHWGHPSWSGLPGHTYSARHDGPSCGGGGPSQPNADGDALADAQDQCPVVAGEPPTGCPAADGVPADVNGDGRADLVHRWSQGVNTWISNGDGSYAVQGFQAQHGYGYGEGVWFTIDANHDGRTDLAHRWSQGVNTWTSNGDGTYTVKSHQAHAGYGYDDGIWFPADGNGDGKTDLVHRWSQGVNTWTSNGDGTYVVKAHQAHAGYGYDDGIWFAADVSGDGRTDLVHRWSQGVNTWTSNGDGTYAVRGFQAHQGYGYGDGTWYAADPNGDGKTDLVHRWSQGVNTWISNGDGTYAIKGHQAHAGYGYNDGSWQAADVSGDGSTDLVHRWSQGVNTWTSNGDGTYAVKAHQAHAGYGYGDGQWPTPLYATGLIGRPPPPSVPPAPNTGPGALPPPPPPDGRKRRRCVVPKLRGLTPRQARKRLRARRCRLGEIRGRRRGRGRLVVVAQSRRAGRSLKRGAKIHVRVRRRRS